MSDPLDLGPIRERCDAATLGPWYSTGDAVPWTADQKDDFTDQGAGISTVPGGSRYEGDIVRGGSQDEQGGAVGVLDNADAAFMAHARTDVPALLAEVKRLRAREAKLRAMVEASFTDGWKWGTTCGDEFDEESQQECWERSDIRRELEGLA